MIKQGVYQLDNLSSVDSFCKKSLDYIDNLLRGWGAVGYNTIVLQIQRDTILSPSRAFLTRNELIRTTWTNISLETTWLFSMMFVSGLWLWWSILSQSIEAAIVVLAVMARYVHCSQTYFFLIRFFWNSHV